jgi:predicted NBD/HSP70 family sugar kinase
VTFTGETSNQILSCLLESGETTSPGIVRETGLSRPTVDTVLASLLSSGIVKKQGIGVSTGGRRPNLFSINQAGRYAVGIVVSVPPVTGVVVDLGGNIHAAESFSIPIWSPGDRFMGQLAGLIESLMARIQDKERFEGVSLAVPGLVDTENGISVFFSRLSNFFNTPLKSILEKRLKVPVEITRYLGSAAYSQVIHLGPKNQKPLIYIELGEGIEMALFSKGMPYRGAIQNEGGLGHMVIEAGGRTCLCGAKGCLEAYACNRVLIDEAKLQVRNGRQSMVPADRDIDEHEFFDYVKKGDALALEVAEKGMEYLALGIANVVNLLNPGRIVVSGAIASAGGPFLEKVRRRILLYALNVLGEELDISFVPFDFTEGAKGVGLSRLYKALNFF